MIANSRTWPRLLLACAFLCVLPFFPVVAQDQVGIARGSDAPAVEIDDLDDGVVNLGDYIGAKPVLLEFWATWCEQCEALQASMDRAFGRYGEEVAFFAVAVGVGQSKRAVRRHVERRSPGYPFLFDSKGAAVRAYRTPTTAYVVIVNAEGKVAYTGVGGSQDIEAALQEVVGGQEPTGKSCVMPAPSRSER